MVMIIRALLILIKVLSVACSVRKLKFAKKKHTKLPFFLMQFFFIYLMSNNHTNKVEVLLWIDLIYPKTLKNLPNCLILKQPRC